MPVPGSYSTVGRSLKDCRYDGLQAVASTIEANSDSLKTGPATFAQSALPTRAVSSAGSLGALPELKKVTLMGLGAPVSTLTDGAGIHSAAYETTLPGFIRPAGSSARLIRLSRSSLTGSS